MAGALNVVSAEVSGEVLVRAAARRPAAVAGNTLF